MPTSLGAQPVDFHLSLNVADLSRSVAFFRRLFGTEPAKLRPDYAKFAVTNPPLTLALEPAAGAGAGRLNHLGFRLASGQELAALQGRLELAGLHSRREEGVECCYSRQTKFWLHDPDGNLWEFYVLEDDIAQRGAGQSAGAVQAPPPPRTASGELAPGAPAAPRTWSHRFGKRFEDRPRGESGSLDAIELNGSFNDAVDAAGRDAMLAEVLRMLRPGGRLLVKCLTAEQPVRGALGLSGPAAAVRAAPVDLELLQAIERAGFSGVRLTRFGASACFVAQGVQLRETTIEALRPLGATVAPPVLLVYKGPARELRLDSGIVLRRGERCAVADEVWREIEQSPLAADVVRLQTQ